MTMSNLQATTAQTRKILGPTKTRPMKQKPNKPPIKVVYISNPMKVKATASQFRSLVQRLTGRDSELPDDYDYDHEEAAGGGNQVVVGGDDVIITKAAGIGDDDVVVNDHHNKSSVSTSASSEPVEATSSCEVGDLVVGDEFLNMGGDDYGLFPVLGSEANFLWTWMC